MSEMNILPFGEEERKRAGKAQMKIFASNQYLYWRVAAVKSIRKIIFNADDFYSDMMDEISAVQPSDVSENVQPDIVNNQIRNGWLFEAVSQAEQGIEDIFSLLMNSKDIAYFAKNVVVYPAGEIKKYIWHFDTESIEHIMLEFGLPYFPLDEPWENLEVYKGYRDAILLIQHYLKELIAFHKKYYLDYCQYKHGMAVALRPFGKEQTKNEVDVKEPGKGFLMTFDSYTVGRRQKFSEALPSMGLLVTEEIQPYVSRLHEEGNLLHYTMHDVDIDEVVAVTEKAYSLLNVVWLNLLKRSELSEKDSVQEWVFPVEDYRKHMIIGFPVDL